jgi:hypothetical protein
MPDGADVEAVHYRRFGVRIGGHDQHRGVDGGSHAHHPGHTTDASIESEFADQAETLDGLDGNFPGGGKHTDGDGEVEAGAALLEAGRREVDGDALLRPPDPGRHDGGAHPVARLAAGGVGQPHDREARQSMGNVDFDPHGQAVDPEQGRGRNGSKHNRLQTEAIYIGSR